MPASKAEDSWVSTKTFDMLGLSQLGNERDRHHSSKCASLALCTTAAFKPPPAATANHKRQKRHPKIDRNTLLIKERDTYKRIKEKEKKKKEKKEKRKRKRKETRVKDHGTILACKSLDRPHQCVQSNRLALIHKHTLLSPALASSLWLSESSHSTVQVTCPFRASTLFPAIESPIP